MQGKDKDKTAVDKKCARIVDTKSSKGVDFRFL